MPNKMAIACTLTFAALTVLTVRFGLPMPNLAKGKTAPELFALNEWGCKAQIVSPTLSWKSTQTNPKGFAIMVHNPGAKTASGGLHQLGTVKHLLMNAKGSTKMRNVSSQADENRGAAERRTMGWGSPCQPKENAPHRHHLTA